MANWSTSVPYSQSPPSWWSGLKFNQYGYRNITNKSPPSWWSGLKSILSDITGDNSTVSTLVVEWIEIKSDLRQIAEHLVSTLVVEWIEIAYLRWELCCVIVSTLVVEWIEIPFSLGESGLQCLSPPSWWSGLKFLRTCAIGGRSKSPPSWWSGLKSCNFVQDRL